MAIDLKSTLDGLSSRTKEKFSKMPTVVDKGDAFDVENLPVDKPEWHAISDVVSVSFDLKSSTNLAKGRSPRSTASIYDAGVGGVVKILKEFDSQFVDIQGDGGFGLFWGESRYERAVACAVTIRTFSANFKTQLEAKWPKASKTEFKVGVGSGSLMAKRVGIPRHLTFQEPVWAGNPVNYSSKAAQQADQGRMYVTGSVWDAIASNDYLAFSCDCSEPAYLWEAITIDKIPDEEKYGQSLGREWCETHGEEYCRAILAGSTHRDNISTSARSKLNSVVEGTTLTHDAVLARSKQRKLQHALFADLGTSPGS